MLAIRREIWHRPVLCRPANGLWAWTIAAMIWPAGVGAALAAAADRPNLVFILADDLGAGDLSSFGAKDLQTPHIDALAAAGMRWDNFHANSPVCSPSRAALLSGRYPDLAGVPGVIRTHPENSWGYLASDVVLLPQVLRRAGYHTALVGKWHLGLEPENRPNLRGFDHFAGFLGDMMDDYYTHRRHGFNYMRRNDQEIDPPGHATELFTEWAVEYIRQRATADQPFFLYLAYNAPHTPIQPPPEWLAGVKRRGGTLDENRARLAALIEHMDDGVGRVVQALKAGGVYEKTLIMFASDNGGQLSVGANNGPLRGGKEDMYEGGLRVPFCAAWPGRIEPGSHSTRLATLMDVFPTLCAAAGAGFEHSVDGCSFLPALRGQDQPQLDERTVFWVRREGGPRYQGQEYYAVRHGPWKLLHNSPFEPLQLFHLGDDPREARDVAGTHRPRYVELSGALRRQIQRAGAVPWQKPFR